MEPLFLFFFHGIALYQYYLVVLGDVFAFFFSLSLFSHHLINTLFVKIGVGEENRSYDMLAIFGIGLVQGRQQYSTLFHVPAQCSRKCWKPCEHEIVHMPLSEYHRKNREQSEQRAMFWNASWLHLHCFWRTRFEVEMVRVLQETLRTPREEQKI